MTCDITISNEKKNIWKIKKTSLLLITLENTKPLYKPSYVTVMIGTYNLSWDPTGSGIGLGWGAGGVL